MTWCVLASKNKRECFFVICQCDKLCVCWAVAQASTFRPSNVAPIILTNSVWYVRKTQKYIFFNVEETMKSVPFSLKKIGRILNQIEYYLKLIESKNTGWKNIFWKILKFKIRRKAMLVLKQTIPQKKALLSSIDLAS